MFFSIDIVLMASLHYCLVVEEVLGDCYRNSSSNDLEEADYINFQLESCKRFLSSLHI